MKCKECVRIAEALGNRTPVGWIPFGTGPQAEKAIHFYVLLETTPEPPSDGTPQAVEVLRLCEVPNPLKRPRLATGQNDGA